MPGESILIVEDERAVARGLEYGLVKEGFSVLWANTGQRALDLARTQPVHLILLDIRMPDMSRIPTLPGLPPVPSGGR